MFTVDILRWLFGYVDFELHGKFPERFINLAAKRGINLWNLSGRKEFFSASTKTALYGELEKIAEKNGNEIHIEKYHGLSHFMKKYKNRSGLIIGAVLFAVLCTLMSKFVWNIKIDAPPSINEYEIRQQLNDLGLHEGLWGKSIDTERIEREMSVKNQKVSWIAVNVLGSDVEVTISEKIESDKQKQTKNDATNIKSSADGVITRMEVKKGRSAVKIGDGVRKNQLLVSGVLEYTDGTISYVDSDAKIYAQTSKSIEINIPKEINLIDITDETVLKSDISIFGLECPVQLGYVPKGNYIQRINKQQSSIFDKTLPIYCNTKIGI